MLKQDTANTENQTTLKIEMADITLCIISQDPDPIRILRKVYKGFLSKKNPNINIRLQAEKNYGTPLPSPSALKVIWQNQSFSVNLGRLIAEGSLATGQIHVRTAHPLMLNIFLAVLFSLFLTEKQGFLLHACGAINDGRAHVFCGASGSGKTTIARLLPLQSILTDEFVAIRKVNGKYHAYATSFSGEMAKVTKNAHAEIKTLYMLHKAKQFSRRKLTSSQAFEKIFPNIFFLRQDPVGIKRLLDICSEVAQAIPCYDLSFPRDRSLWSYINGIT